MGDYARLQSKRVITSARSVLDYIWGLQYLRLQMDYIDVGAFQLEQIKNSILTLYHIVNSIPTRNQGEIAMGRSPLCLRHVPDTCPFFSSRRNQYMGLELFTHKLSVYFR